jgi:translocation and assembly module TamB
MRCALRIGAWTVGSLLTVIVAFIALVLLAGNTVRGRVWIERATAHLSDGHVRLSGLSGSFPAAVDLRQLQLADGRGVWLSAERISLRWSPLALLARHLKVQRLQLARLAIERRSATETSQAGSRTRLPHIDIGKLSIDTLELGPELTGVRARLSIEGTAHVASLTDTTVSITARRTDAPGNYKVSLRCDPSRVDATLRLEEPPGGALGNLLKLPGLGTLSVDAKLNGPREVERLEVTARAGELHALAQGSVDLTRSAADLVYRLDAPSMRPREGLSWQRIATQGRWQGTLDAPHADAQLRIDGLRTPGSAGVEMLSANLSADGGDLAVHATAAGFVIPGPQPRLLAESPLHVDATMRLRDATRPLQLTASHRLFSLRTQAVTGGALRATFDLRLPDLAPLAAVAGQKLRGTAAIKGTLKQSSATTRLDLDGNTELAQGATLLTSMLAGASHLQLAATFTERAIDVERLTLDGRVLTVSASGSAERGATTATGSVQSLRARYEASVANLAALSPALEGTLKLNGQVAGPIASLVSQAQLTSSLSIRHSPRETIDASLTARSLPANAIATLQARGGLAGGPLQLDASLAREAGDAFHLTVRRAEWKSAHLEGDLTTAANTAPGHGILRLRMERLEDLEPLVGTSLKGSVSASLALRGVEQRTYAQLQLDARDIVAAAVQANGRLTASGPLDALALQVNVQSPDLRGERGSLETAAQLNFAARELRFTRAEAHYHRQTLRLLAPSVVAFAEGVDVKKLKLGIQSAVVDLDGRVSPALDLQASVHHVDAALISAFVPDVLAQGTLDVDARLRGTFSAPSGLVTLSGTGLQAAATGGRDLQPIDVHATARLKEDTAQLDAHLVTGRGSQVTLTGNAPLTPNGTFNLKVSGKLDVGLVNPLLEARGERAAGALAVNATVTGPPRLPELGGTLDLTNGDLRDYAEGAHLSGIAGHLVASQGNLKVESLTAHAGPGQISMTGTIGVLQPKLPLILRLTAKNARPITSDILNVSLNADLKAEGNLRGRLDLSGTIDLNRTVIGIPNALPPQVAVLDVRHPGQAPPPPPERKLVIGLDLKIHAPREILVQGRGLNAELGGDLHVGGTTANPSVSGGFEMIRGTFSLASTQLKFTSGRVSFTGAGLKGKIDPSLDFTAQSTVSDATTTLHITGLADAPQFALSSSPPLPQDEILARLLFGESASQLTVLQLAQIGAALASLSGVGGSGPNPLARVQKTLGLDRLSVSGGSGSGGPGAQSSGTTVEAGRYVSNRVFVGAKESTTGFSQVEVDVDLSKHLKLQTRVGNGTATTQGITPENDPGSSLGVVYQFEY